MVQLNSGGNWLRADDVKSGDVITFKDGGEVQVSDKYRYTNKDGSEGNFKKSFVATVDHNGNLVSMRVNKTSQNALVASYGTDTEGWIGKSAKVSKEHSRQINADVIYLEPTDAAPESKEETEEDWE